MLRSNFIHTWVPSQDVDILRSHPATGGRPGPTRFNGVVYCRGFLYLAGQIVEDTSAPGMDTYYGQAKKVLHQVGQLLEDSGSCIERVLQASRMHPLHLHPGLTRQHTARERLLHTVSGVLQCLGRLPSLFACLGRFCFLFRSRTTRCGIQAQRHQWWPTDLLA